MSSPRRSSAVSAVLDRSQPRFVLDHQSQAEDQTRWWSLLAVPLHDADGGAVVTRTDVTELRKAEIDALRGQQQLAHVARVSTMGELTASLAHQLNQPLTAILTNAQAAQRILSTPAPDLSQVRDILSDIVRDDWRASEVIVHLRNLLRRGQREMQPINLTSAIREVAQLVSSEAVIRNVSLSLQFDGEPVFVRGDRVHLQQVVLNLLHNAIEATGDQLDRLRTVQLRCAPEPEQVRVSVHDSGPGVDQGLEETIFEPFYTTKPGGMGMGLSIARSIVEAHGGSIRATNGRSHGALFEVVLPIDREAA